MVLIKDWLSGAIVGTLGVVIVVIFTPGWLVFYDPVKEVDVKLSIFYWLICANQSCGSHSVGTKDAYVYVENTSARPETTLLLVSVDMVLCIMCIIIVVGDMTGSTERVTWWNERNIGVVLLVLCIFNLIIIGMFGHASIDLSSKVDVKAPYSILILSLAALMTFLEFSFLIYSHFCLTIPYRQLNDGEEEPTPGPSGSQEETSAIRPGPSRVRDQTNVERRQNEPNIIL